MPGQQNTMSGTAVAAAVIVDGRVLVGRRTNPERLKGMWEFPGGNASAAESEPAEHALVRTCRDELGVELAVDSLLGVEPVTDEFNLNVYRAHVVAGEPAPIKDHDELRWLASDELDSVPWAPIDAKFKGLLREAMAGG